MRNSSNDRNGRGHYGRGHCDGAGRQDDDVRLRQILGAMKTATDRHEQNVELRRNHARDHSLSSSSPSSSFCLHTLRHIGRGQPLLIWYGEELARELGVPILTPSNIRGHQEYICTGCNALFAQPNVLKAHMFFQCQGHSPATYGSGQASPLVPFHVLLENISSRLLKSTAAGNKRRGRTACDDRDNNIIIHTGDSEQLEFVAESRTKRSCEEEEEEHQQQKNRNTVDKTQSLDVAMIMSEAPEFGRQSTKLQIRQHGSMAESTQSELSPSLSSISSDSSSIEEDDAHAHSVFSSDNNNRKLHHIVTATEQAKSAFHRPTRSRSFRTDSQSDDATMTPDSSTDQHNNTTTSNNRALNLSVKTDYQFLSIPSDHHHLPSFSNLRLTHPWAMVHGTTHPPPSYPNPSSFSSIPLFYPVSHRVSSTPLSYLAVSQQHHTPRAFSTRRQRMGPHAASQGTPLRSHLSPKREHSMPSIPAFPSPSGCLIPDNPTPPLNPYGLDLPSDKEPLDLLPQTYFTNKSKRGHLCLYCGKLYSRKYGLKIHMRTHNGYKPLKCKICSRPFGDPSNLNKHVRLHAQGDTPYRCDYCGKVLVRRRDLERHVRSRHPMGSLPAETSPPSSPISVDDVDTSTFQEDETPL